MKTKQIVTKVITAAAACLIPLSVFAVDPCTSEANGTSPCNLHVPHNYGYPACDELTCTGPSDNYLYTSGTDFIVTATYSVPYACVQKTYKVDYVNMACNYNVVTAETDYHGTCDDYDSSTDCGYSQ